MQLTPHFTLEELTRSTTATRLGIDNTPTGPALNNLHVLAEGLEQVRAMTGQPLWIHSGYRCEALEHILAAKDFDSWCRQHKRPTTPEDRVQNWADYFARKAHPKGMAADFTCAAYGNPLEIVRAIKASGIKFDQLIMEGTWVHISFARDTEGKMRNEVLVATFSAGGVTYAASPV